MIRTIRIKINAAYPQLPLGPVELFEGSAASFTICDVPRAVGKREVTGIALQVKNAGGEVTSFAAVRVGSAWEVTATADALGGSGFVGLGVRVNAYGTDENGAITSWIVGMADLKVMTADGTVKPGESVVYTRLLDAEPETPHKGDLCKIGGVWKLYTGSAWETICAGVIKATPEFISVDEDGEITAIRATTAETAAQAGRADTAGWADGAGTAQMADSANYAQYASAAGEAQGLDPTGFESVMLLTDSTQGQDQATDESVVGRIKTLEAGGGGGGLTGHKLTVNYVYGGGNTDSSVIARFANGSQLRYGTQPISPDVISVGTGESGTFVIDDVVAYCVSPMPVTISNLDYATSYLRSTLTWVGMQSDTTITRYSGCLLRGTPVTLADGTVKNIEDVEYTDELLVWDFDNGQKASSKPAWIKKREDSSYWFENRFANGTVLKTTGRSKTGWGHRGYNVTRGRFTYFPASVGDDFMMEDGTVSTLVSCERKEEACEFYNVITKEHFNLYADGVLTSCSLNNCYPITTGHRFHVYESPFACTREDFASLDDEFGKELVDRYYKDLRLGEQCRTVGIVDYVRNLMLNRKEAN